MALNIKKFSQLDTISYLDIDGTNILHLLEPSGSVYLNKKITIGELFKGTNNVTTNILFNNNTFIIQSGNVSITGSETISKNLIVSGNTSISQNLTVSGNTSINILKSNSTPLTTYQEIINAIYPVNSLYFSVSSTNPNTTFGIGTWVAWGSGKVPVGVNTGDSNFNTVEKTGGSSDAIIVSHSHTATSVVTDNGHTHTTPIVYSNEGEAQGDPWGSGDQNSRPEGTYNFTTASATTGVTVATTIATTGSTGTNQNLQPYITCYIWKRTA